MLKTLKRLRLTHILLIIEILTGSITLILKALGVAFADEIGPLWNILNSLLLLLAYLSESRKNERYYELAGHFIFGKLGENFSSFLDFMISEDYKNDTVSERLYFKEKLKNISQNGEYEQRRKLARALPNFYSVDKENASKILETFRNESMTDISDDLRRRSLEAILLLIQKAPDKKEQRRRYRRFKKHIKYVQGDDAYVIVALIELLFFVQKEVVKESQKKKIDAMFIELKKDVAKAINDKTKDVPANMCEEISNGIKVLELLRRVGETNGAREEECVSEIKKLLAEAGFYTELIYIKNLCYTCSGYPECLKCDKCPVNYTPKYLLDASFAGLMRPIEKPDDVFLVMPASRYFECACNNLSSKTFRKKAQTILTGYYTSPILLIIRSSFDKLSKLYKKDPAFAAEVTKDMTESLTIKLKENSKVLDEMLAALPCEKRDYYTVTSGRKKYHEKENLNFEQKMDKAADKGCHEVEKAIDRQNDLLSFIGEVKSMTSGKKISV